MRITRVVETSLDIREVYALLADFTTTEQWDPGTVHTTLLHGDGGIGTVYANTSVFNGRKTDLTYTVIDCEPPRRIRLRGENATVTAVDTMTFEPLASGGTRVTYDAAFTFHGIARLAAPFLASAFRRLGDAAEVGLRTALANRAGMHG